MPSSDISPVPLPRAHLRGVRGPAAALLVGGALALAAAGAAAGAGAGTTAALRAPAHPEISLHAAGGAEHDSQSNNWSGYDEGFLSTDKTFSSISADWVVPTATQHAAGQAEDSATWIGIGGGCVETSCTVTDETLIQAGTEQDVAADGTASYSAWWELVPVPSVSASIPVSPGDHIHCSISAIVPGVWDISLQDLTNGQSFSETLPYPSSELTAEWIEETPLEVGTSGSGLAALPDLSTVSFTNAEVDGAPAGLTSADAIQLTDSSGNPIATPSAPGSDGASFNDCAWATACAAP
jgi:hypothetical protein